MERHDTWTLKSQKEFCLKGTALGTDRDLEEQEPRAKDKEIKGEKSHRPNKGPTQGTIHKNMPKKPRVGRVKDLTQRTIALLQKKAN